MNEFEMWSIQRDKDECLQQLIKLTNGRIDNLEKVVKDLSELVLLLLKEREEMKSEDI